MGVSNLFPSQLWAPFDRSQDGVYMTAQLATKHYCWPCLPMINISCNKAPFNSLPHIPLPPGQLGFGKVFGTGIGIWSKKFARGGGAGQLLVRHLIFSKNVNFV